MFTDLQAQTGREAAQFSFARPPGSYHGFIAVQGHSTPMAAGDGGGEEEVVVNLCIRYSL